MGVLLTTGAYHVVEVANTQSNTVSVLLDAGGGTFAAQATYATGGAPSSLAICSPRASARAP